VKINLFSQDGALATSYELSNATVVSDAVDILQDGTKRIPVEEVAFDYTRIKQSVFLPSGPVNRCWDRTAKGPC
jgi:hypothetical protein